MSRVQQNTEERRDAPVLRMILAGMASVCAGGTTHPVDTIKVILQKEGEGGKNPKKYHNIYRGAIVIIQEEGFLALYKGLGPSLMREASYSTLRLGLYEPFKYLLGAKDKESTTVWKMFGAGVLSGSTGALVANPFDLLKVRLQSQEKSKNNSILSEVSNVIKNEGAIGMYKGLLPNILRGAILTGTKMATYDQTKQSLIKYLHFKEGFKLYFVCSFVTGLMLSITTAPMDLIKTRIMSQESGHRVYNGLVDCAYRTLKQEGFGAFYKGFLPQWIRFGPFNVIQLIVWEELRTVFKIKNI